MNEHVKHPPASDSHPQEEPDVLALIKKIQQHLVFLEKKIDLLIGQSSQSSERPFNKERRFSRPFSKPFRPGGHSSHPRDNRERHHSSSERGFSQGRRSFEGPRGSGENRGFGDRGKKPFFSRRKSRG